MIEYFIGGAIVSFCTYMSYRGKKKVQDANERMKLFQEDCKILGDKLEIDLLARSYGLINISASFDGHKEGTKQIFLDDLIIE